MNEQTGDVLTFGIEEEFFVVDRRGHLSQAGDDVVDAAEAAEDVQGELQHELNLSQAEAATGVCRTHAEALRQLGGLREDLARAARARGYRLLPAGAPPMSEVDPPRITPNPRYQRMAEHFGATAWTSLTCGCHVHVAIPDKESGIRVLGRVRPWLPALLAVTANSAIVDGYDTGYASWRYHQWSRWPSAGPPPRFASLDEYESVVDGWLRAGAILDRAMVYWDVRLAEKQPTLEFRISDVAATPAEAVLLGVLARGLVATALADDRPPPELSNEVLRGWLWRASREGPTGCCPDPRTGDLRPAASVLGELVSLTAPALEAAGDLEFARDGLARLTAEGGGADRQRRAFEKKKRAADVVDLLAGDA
ncbi:glutamate--cysteine ligase [Amycolatopsis sp. OK19-0408]|uniref:Putative glutamate--cysteine ligase 2 n=1 Tax=Amycolatopsis iheyensis TaxID=2945988 RepID=A0A9X2NB12_9PSEU|nr:glutamate--cysteine ligase [Amycolatopsis iheyensis]MCR6483800.1 glutamate--cysteine ligase [Amycolatopsis iheyensis]